MRGEEGQSRGRSRKQEAGTRRICKRQDRKSQYEGGGEGEARGEGVIRGRTEKWERKMRWDWREEEVLELSQGCPEAPGSGEKGDKDR